MQRTPRAQLHFIYLKLHALYYTNCHMVFVYAEVYILQEDHHARVSIKWDNNKMKKNKSTLSKWNSQKLDKSIINTLMHFFRQDHFWQQPHFPFFLLRKMIFFGYRFFFTLHWNSYKYWHKCEKKEFLLLLLLMVLDMLWGCCIEYWEWVKCFCEQLFFSLLLILSSLFFGKGALQSLS